MNNTNDTNSTRWLAVVAVGISVFLSALDGSIVALALPPIGSAFHLSRQLTSLVPLAYAVPLTLLILPVGALIGRFRSLPIFLEALAGFAAGTALCGLAPSFEALILGRVIQGAAAAVISTLGFAVAAGIVAPTERGRAIGIVGSLAPLGAIVGPGVGGQLLAHFGWSSVFFVNLPVCAAAALLGAVSLGSFRVGSARPQASPSAPGRPAGGMAHLLGTTVFRRSLLGFLMSVTIGAGLYYLLPFDLGSVHGLSTSASGLVLLCMPLGMGVIGFAAGFLVDRYGPGVFAVLGSALILADLLALLPVLTHPVSALGIAWRLALLGVATGLLTSPIQTILMSAGGRQSMAAASALSNLSARVGSVLGPLLVAVLWSLIPDALAQMRGGGILLLGLALVTVFCTGSVALATGAFRPRERPEPGAKAPETQAP